jgi:hypothetical protein
MEMMLHTGSRATAKVHSNIKAIRLVGLLQGRLATLDQLQYLCRLILRRLLKICAMDVGSDQEMPRGIGKDIEDNEAEPTSKNYKIPFVILTGGVQAEYAAARILKTGNVLIPPGSPEIIHD